MTDTPGMPLPEHADEIDGCLSSVPVIDDEQLDDIDVPFFVLFAGVDTTDPAAVAAKEAEWREVWPDAV